MKEYIIKVDETVEIDKKLFDNIIDVKRFITCKDCKHFYKAGKHTLRGNTFVVDSDRCIEGFNKTSAQLVSEYDYCSRAERKEDE